VTRSPDSDLSSTASSRDEWDEWYEDADDSFQGLKENKLARMMTEAENSPIRHYQTLWGMKDVDLKFTPEALEIIANQVPASLLDMCLVYFLCQPYFALKSAQSSHLLILFSQALAQQAGRDGVARILEKLFLTVKFDILGTDVVAVEITEDFVLGKCGPVYHHASRKKSCTHSRSQPQPCAARTNANGLDCILEEAPSSLSDYDQGVLEQIEI
jgi:hypothetical protein